MAVFLPTIPESVTVHLGPPASPAKNVTLSFPDYIKNVASSEIYPTWNEAALRANILAQISFALNRIYTQYYRSRGYAFDITNDISIDQSFVYGREIYANISRIVDEIFNSYLRRAGTVEPLFALYCDGVEVSCGGLSQWGSQQLAAQGLSTLDILKRYYGQDIEIVTNAPVSGRVGVPAPKVPLRLGSAGPDVQILQVRLNRISADFPALPKIHPTDGIFGPDTEAAVKAFQRTFDLTPDGVVGTGTWFRIARLFYSVKRLNQLSSEGLRLEEITTEYPLTLARGSRGNNVRILQYYLNYVGTFLDSVPAPRVDGIFGPETERAVLAYQRAWGLTPDGVVGEFTWDSLYRTYLGMVGAIPLVYSEGVTVPFPGIILKVGSEGDDVRLLQNYLNYVGQTYTSIPRVEPTGYFGTATAAAVDAFVRQFGLNVRQGIVTSTFWEALTDVYADLYFGNRASVGQYPGYTVN